MMAAASTRSSGGGDYLIARVRLAAAGFWLLFNAYSSTQFLQSSLNKATGYTCLSLLYGLFALSALITPLVISSLKPLLVIPVAALCYIWVVAANIQVEAGALLSGCGAVGVAAALLWGAQGLYTTQVAVAYAHQTGEPLSDATSLMNGAFFGIFTSAGGSSYLLSSLVLLFVPEGVSKLFIILVAIGLVGVLVLCCLHEPDDVHSSRVMEPPLFLVGWRCGRSARRGGAPRDGPTPEQLPPPGDSSSGGSAAAAAAAPTGAEHKRTDDAQPPSSLAHATAPLAVSPSKIPPPGLWYMVRFLLTERRMLLMTPVVCAFGANMGLQQSLWIASLGGQVIGAQYVGLVGCCYSWSTAISTVLWGRAVRDPRFGRRWAFIVSALLYCVFLSGSIAWAYTYPPNGSVKPPLGSALGFLFGSAVVYACADGVWYVQLPAVLQTMYPMGADAACVNAAIRLYTSLGFAVQAAISAGVGPGEGVWQQMVGCLAFFLVACCTLAYVHCFVTDLDTGKARDGGTAATAALPLPCVPAAMPVDGSGVDPAELPVNQLSERV